MTVCQLHPLCHVGPHCSFWEGNVRGTSTSVAQTWLLTTPPQPFPLLHLCSYNTAHVEARGLVARPNAGPPSARSLQGLCTVATAQPAPPPHHPPSPHAANPPGSKHNPCPQSGSFRARHKIDQRRNKAMPAPRRERAGRNERAAAGSVGGDGGPREQPACKERGAGVLGRGNCIATASPEARKASRVKGPEGGHFGQG